MTSGRRALKVGKWTALTLFVLSLAAWVLAANWLLGFPLSPRDTRGNGQELFIAYGAVGITRTPDNSVKFRLVWTGAWFRSRVTYPLSIPAWWLPAVTLPLTATLFFIDRRRRISAGRCRQCGYDLRGTVSDRCSECGEALDVALSAENVS